MKLPNIGEAIRMGRMKKGWSQKKLAERMEITPAAVCNWEKNKTSPPGDTLIILTRLLNLFPYLFPKYYREIEGAGEEKQRLHRDISHIREEVQVLREKISQVEGELRTLRKNRDSSGLSN